MTTGNVRPASMERITTPALAQKFIDEQIKEVFGIKVPYWTDSLKKCLSTML